MGDVTVDIQRLHRPLLTVRRSCLDHRPELRSLHGANTECEHARPHNASTSQDRQLACAPRRLLQCDRRVLLILAALGRAASLGQSPFWLAAQGVLYLVLGMVALVVYRDLNRGENWARVIFTVVLVIGVLTNLARAIGGRELNAWWGVAVDVVALIALYVPQQCREFFAASTQ